MVAARTKTPSDQMLMALGAGTLNWSLLEAGIDALVASVFHHFGGKTFQKELPRMMGKKIEFLKKGFRRAPLLQHLAEEGCALFDAVEALSKRRNLLIHGTPTSFWEDRIEFTWLKVTPTIHKVEYHTVTHDEMYELAMSILPLGLDLGRFSYRIAGWMIRDKNKEPNSELP